MRLTTQVGLLAGASALALSSASFADATANDQEARIAELEAKVAELTGQSWMTEQRAMEVRGLVQDVLEDADTRSSLLQGGGMGYDNGFVIGNPDGGFGLKINGQLQVRHVFNNADESIVNANGGATTTNPNLSGFENTRTKLMVSGNVGDWVFAIEGNYGVSTDATTTDGTFNLEDAWVGYEFGNGWSVFMGQGRVPLQREHMVTSANQLAVERSTASYINPHGRTQGIMLAYEMDQWGFVAGFNDGAATPAVPVPGLVGYTGPAAPGLANSTVLVNPQGGGSMDTEYAFSFRGEYLASGTWAQFEDFTSKQGSAAGFLIGAAFHTQTGEYGTAATSTDLTAFSADLSYEGDGWNVFGAYTWTDIDYNVAGINKQQMNTVVLQGGFYLNATWELFARYEWVDYDLPNVVAPALNPDDLSIITFGVNGYYTDNVKITSDFSFGLNEIATTNSLTGVRTDGRGGTVGTPGSWNDGQFVWKTQLQLTF